MGEFIKKKNIVQGEYHVSGEPNVVITTLLGSCIAACLFDPVAQIGGMNHFLLPGDLDQAEQESSRRYGVHLMELLVNGLLKSGAARHRLQAKVFGGAKTVPTLGDVGASNVRFAKEFLEQEDIKIVSSSTGGVVGRRLQFWPTSGRASQMYMRSDESFATIRELKPRLSPAAGELELF